MNAIIEHNLQKPRQVLDYETPASFLHARDLPKGDITGATKRYLDNSDTIVALLTRREIL
jgi:hypothetical protein